ncbi:unnamed protein product, partial [Choristocarpus tenellus]
MKTVEILVNDTTNIQTFCGHGKSCLADGALTVRLNGIEVTAPAHYFVGNGMEVSTANLPGECRPFGFEKYWQRKVHEAELATQSEQSSRALRDVKDMDEWILSDLAKTNPDECESNVRNVAEEGNLFNLQSEHISFQIVTPTMTLRLNHGKLHQLAMPDPSGLFDLPDHLTYQINVGFVEVGLGSMPQGILGETAVPNTDKDGSPIREEMGSIRGGEEDYRVNDILGTDFKQLH